MNYFDRKQAFMSELCALLRKHDVVLMPDSFKGSTAQLMESKPDSDGAVFFVSPKMIHDALNEQGHRG